MRTLVSAAALLVAGIFGSRHAPAQVTEADDAYHFQYWEGTPENALYTEWWYFNFYDQKDDLQAIFTYQIIDPLNLAGIGGGQVSAVAYQGSNTITEYVPVPLSSFQTSYAAANVAAGTNTVTVQDANTYVVSGSSPDGRMSWNLTYIRLADSWLAAQRVAVGGPAWEQMSWLVYMPRAQVSGTFTLDGTTYQLDCIGYHDHNWGQWNFLNVQWNWAQYAQPGLTFDLGDFPGNPNGRARINVAGHEFLFAASQYTLTHTKWAYDSQNQLPYPTESLFTADNGTVQLSMKIAVQKTEPLASGPPPALVIYEQPSHFTGLLKSSNGSAPSLSFEGDGFSEYTGKSGGTN